MWWRLLAYLCPPTNALLDHNKLIRRFKRPTQEAENIPFVVQTKQLTELRMWSAISHLQSLSLFLQHLLCPFLGLTQELRSCPCTKQLTESRMRSAIMTISPLLWFQKPQPLSATLAVPLSGSLSITSVHVHAR